MSIHKNHLIVRSEQVVDLQAALEAARSADDRLRCEELFAELERIADDLVGLQHDLEGDDLAFSHFMLGSICALMGLWTHAESAYTLALAHWPDHVGLLNEMAECQFELGNYPSATLFIERSMAAGGVTPERVHELAVSQAWSGEVAKARITLINGTARFPDNAALIRALHEMDHPPATS